MGFFLICGLGYLYFCRRSGRRKT
uniref:GlyGly-CTERM sorting domain-containing protein n=1 Tax=Planktothricoides sp. SpSt-374 TaxID=2282167 RepID=A0A7C3VQR0_9CYAN